VGNSAISGFTGPYDNVLVTLTSSTTATVQFTSNTVGGNIYLMGDGGSVGVNVNAATWTISNITGSNAGTGFTPGPYSDGGSGNQSGTTMNQTVTSFDGFTHSSDTISFTLTNTSTTWANAASVLAANSDGYYVTAHIFVTSAPANASNGAIVTGFGAGSLVPNVPEPSSMAIAGLGALGLVGFGLRRRRVK
jgi:MYXO-CTERM domain-containing protein